MDKTNPHQPPSGSGADKPNSQVDWQVRVAHLRHDLRTPVNAIIGYSEMLAEEAEDMSQNEVVEELNSIQADGRLMLASVNRTLAISRVKVIDLPDWSRLGDELLSGAQEAVQRVILKSKVLAERSRNSELGEFIPDLNEIETAAGSFLRVMQSLKEGFDQEDSSKERVELEKTSSLIKELEPRKKVGEALGSGLRGHVLVVDDNKMNRVLLSRYLKRLGHQTMMARDGEEALQLLSKHSFDLVFLDVMMPGLDGYETLRRIKTDTRWREIPVIMISALDDLNSIVRCIEIGAEDYLPKPFEPVLLRARIDASLEKKRLRDLELRNQQELERLNSQLERRSQFIRQTFGRYLSDDIVETILETPQGLKIGGEERQVTIMMADLRGFTAMGERLPPEGVVSMINTYLEKMTEIVFKYQGTIDEFIGDAILVLFGAPILREDDAQRAVACAMEMQLAMPEINKCYKELGFPEVGMGIGLNTGDVVVGNIGSSKRSKYGVVGRNVNLASRIESYTVGGQILASTGTVEQCGSILRIDGSQEIMPKGLAEPIKVYEIGGIEGTYNIFLPRKINNLRPLDRKLDIQFSVLMGKDTDTVAREAQLTAVSRNALQLTSTFIPELSQNLKITLYDLDATLISSEVYAKVTEATPTRGCFVAHITSVSQEISVFLESLLSASE